MRATRFGPAAALCMLVLVACQPEHGAEHGGEDDAGDEETAPVPVETARPQRGDVYATYTGTAPIEAYAEADVIAKVDGEVRELLVEEGDEVSAGQVLARLDGERLRLELNESEAQLRKLQRDYERNVDLVEKGLISEGDFEKIKFEMEALEAAFNLASLELDYTYIRAPIEGVVSERYIKLGNTISTGEPLFRVTSLEPLVAYLHAPEKEYRRIEAGQTAIVQIDALAGAPIQATVSRISPVVDAETGTFKVTVEIVDPEHRIKPGMFGRVSIIHDRRVDALQVPRSAIIEDGDELSVFVVSGDVAKRRNVTTGYGNRGMIEIISGLDDSDEVVTVGHLGLKEDSRVAVIGRPEAATVAGEPEDAAEQRPEQVSDGAAAD